MQSRTHLISTVSLCTLPFILKPELITDVSLIPFYLGGLMIGSQFPDIDEPHSAIGRNVSKFLPFIPALINLAFGHRGLTHQFIFFLFPLIAVLIFSESMNIETLVFSISFCFGMLFHQFGDMISGSKRFKGGIKNYFFPFIINDRYFTPFPYIFRCAVGDFKEKIYLVLFFALFLFELKYLFIDLSLLAI